MNRTFALMAICVIACATAPRVRTQRPPGAAELAAAAAPLPDTSKAPTADTFHGTEVRDDYRWLEDAKDPRVQAWSDAQNAHARAFLDHVPGREALQARHAQLATGRPPSLGGLTWRPGRAFAMRRDPAHKQQPTLVALQSLTSEEGMRTVVDPNELDPTGQTAIDWVVPSPDGSKVAVSLSHRGSEAGTLHVFDANTGERLAESIPRVQLGTAGGSVAWTAGSSGFLYTRYPREGERPKEDLDFYQQVYFHKLGADPKEDAYSLGRELPRIAEIRLAASEDGAHHLALVQNGDGGDYALYYLPPQGAWTQVSRFEDGIVFAAFGRDGAIWALGKKDAPRRRLLRIPLAQPTLQAAKVIVDQQQGVLVSAAPASGLVYALEAWGGQTRVRAFTLEGRPVDDPPRPSASAAGMLQVLGGDQVFYSTTSYLQPMQGVAYDPGTKVATPTLFAQKAAADFSDAEVIEEAATSKDGTRVPLYIVQLKGTPRDGKRPTLLTGYGGFGISMGPHHRDALRVRLERGVVFVQAVLRGGGEFGQRWRDGGRLLRKQNTFDDFLAAAERLIELGYTSPEKLAIEGGSNGGLLMGAALTQRPDLFAAVISHVGIYDMLHIEQSANGQFNVTEYGTVKDPQQFAALYAYSPYRRVRDGVRYPPVLLLTGANDPRVDPMQSRKMAARLQAADPGDTVLLRTSASTGHGGRGAGVRAVIEQRVDADAFLLYELGVPLQP